MKKILRNIYINNMRKSAILLSTSNSLLKYITFHTHMDLASKYGYFEIITNILDTEDYSINYYNNLFDIAFESGDTQWINNVILMREEIF